MTTATPRRYLSATTAAVLLVAVSQPALATDPTPHWCEGIRIAAFPGGYEPGRGDLFSEAIYNGFRQAELDLGPTVTYHFSHWSPDQMARDFKQVIDEKVDGVALVAFGLNADAHSLIHQAFSQGTIVISAAVELPDDEKAYSAQGMGYVGAPLSETGVAIANELTRRAGLKSGDRVLVWGQVGEDGEVGPFLRGIADTLGNAGVNVVYLGIDPSAENGDMGPSIEALKKAMIANPDIKAVFIEQGLLTANAALLAEELRQGQVYVVGSELSSSALKALRNGYLNLIVDEQPYLNGYLPILNICLTKKFGFSGLHFNRGIIFVDASNIDAVAPLVDKMIR
jgi:simple sugar transport system substrate-binding protein